MISRDAAGDVTHQTRRPLVVSGRACRPRPSPTTAPVPPAAAAPRPPRAPSDAAAGVTGRTLTCAARGRCGCDPGPAIRAGYRYPGRYPGPAIRAAHGQAGLACCRLARAAWSRGLVTRRRDMPGHIGQPAWRERLRDIRAGSVGGRACTCPGRGHGDRDAATTRRQHWGCMVRYVTAAAARADPVSFCTAARDSPRWSPRGNLGLYRDIRRLVTEWRSRRCG